MYSCSVFSWREKTNRTISIILGLIILRGLRVLRIIQNQLLQLFVSATPIFPSVQLCKLGSILVVIFKVCTQGDLTQFFPTFSNPILNLNFYINADPKSTYVSNIQQNSVELCANLRFFHQAPIL